MDPQERALKSGVDIVVATPGRLMDHMRSSAVAFDKLDTLVLDEADRMMDMGFWPDVRRIVAALPDCAARQTLLFSATMPEEVMKLADEVVRDAELRADRIRGGPAQSITHTIERSPARRRPTGWRSSFAAPRAGAGVRAHEVGRGAAGAQARSSSASRPRRCTPTARSSSGRRRSKGSAAGATACSSPPTSPRAGSTSTASPTS